jgi:uncharacterized tellurite resistance protein B-like protein
MTTDQKKAFLLLKSVILHHQGLEEGENVMLTEAAMAMNASEELEWTRQFILQDQPTAFERAREYLSSLVTEWDKNTRLEHLAKVWESINQKGYISEMEATAILKLAKDWQIQRELMTLIRQKRNTV